MTEAELLSSLQQAIASDLEREPPVDADGLAAFREAIEHTDASLLYHYHYTENSGSCSPRLPLGTSPSAYPFASVPKRETSRSLGRSRKANGRPGCSGTPPRRTSLSRDPAYASGGGKKQQTAANGAAGTPVGRRRKRVHRHEGWSYRILWLPVLLCILCIVAFELLVYVLVRQIVNFYEYFCLWRGEKFRLRMQLRQTKSYSEWKTVALALDAYMGNDEWKKEEPYRYYDHVLIRKLVRHLVMYRRALGDPPQSQAPPSLTASMVAASPESNGTGSGSGVRERILGTTESRRLAPSISDAWAITVSAPCIFEGRLDKKEKKSGIASADDGLGPPDRGVSPSGLSSSASLAKMKEVLLQGGVKSNVGGVENDWLYKQTYFGTKELVERFYEEVALSLETIGNLPPSILSTEDKRAFFRRADRTYGRTALCLSGGAAFGYYHLGVCKALLEGGVLPQVITGTSAGSMIAALICCRTDGELRQVLRPALHKRLTACGRGPLYEWFFYLQRYCTIGAMYDANSWAEKTQWVTRGNMTFLEAYKRTGRILNITAVPNESHSPPKLLNYITTPDTVIWSAVLASSAVPGILKPVVLMNKTPEGKLVPFVSTGVKWRDGSLRTDIPLQELQQYFDVKYTIVSQVNPHISIFFFESRGSVGRPSAHRNGSGWRGGFALAGMEHFLKLDLKKWLRVIRDLDLMPNFLQIDWRFLWLQKFDGNITILPKSSFSDFVHILTDPTEERLANYIARGERNTWPKIHMIRNRMLLERTIIRGMLKARKEMRGMRAAASVASSSESLSPGSSVEDTSKVPGLPARAAPFARDEPEVPAQHPTNEEQNEIERERQVGKRGLLARAAAATSSGVSGLDGASVATFDSALSSVSSFDRSFASPSSPDSDVDDGSLTSLETSRNMFRAPAEEGQHWTTDSEGDEEDEIDPVRWEDEAEERSKGIEATVGELSDTGRVKHS